MNDYFGAHMSTVGKRIAEMRDLANLKPNQLAFRVGYKSPSRLSNYENGIRQPPIEEVRTIADALTPILGDHVLFYILTGRDYRDEIENYSEPEITVQKAALAFKELIAEMEELGRIKIEPGLDVSDLAHEFTKSFLSANAGNLKAL